MPDEFIRQRMSTSPEQEPDDFEEQIKNSYKVLLKSPSEIFPNNQPRRYKMINGVWKLQT